MKLCRFDGGKVGLVDGDMVFDCSHEVGARQTRESELGFLESILFAAWVLDLTPTKLRSKGIPVASVKLDSPLTRPGKIIAAPVNYRDHTREMIEGADRKPSVETDIARAGLFLKATSSIAGPSDALKIRFPQRRTDHEVELVAVIGRPASNVAESEALSYVAGYMLGLDITLRGPEDRSFRKSIDGYSIIGPYLVTPSEMGDPNDHMLTCAVNGVRRQHASTRDMVFSVERLISFASTFYTLEPGDLLFTGTPSGVGPIVAGDVVSASSALLGRLEINVV